MHGWIFFPIKLCVKLRKHFKCQLFSALILLSLRVFMACPQNCPNVSTPSNGNSKSRCEGSQPSVRAIQAQSLLLCDQVMLQKCLLKPSNTGYQFILLPKAQWLKGSVSIWSLFRQDTCETIAQLMMDNFSHTTGSHQGWILSSSKWATPHKAMKEWNKIPRAKTSVSLDN